MSWEDALRAITLVPAEVMGVADRIGSIAAGRDANLAIWSGDPFEFSSVAERVWVQARKPRSHRGSSNSLSGIGRCREGRIGRSSVF